MVVSTLVTRVLSALPFRPFREGIEIVRLFGDGHSGPSCAFLRYAPGAQGPEHVHEGKERILVLAGAQSDQRGTYPVGSYVVNSPGTTHAVASSEGCIVLILWEQPIRFL